MIAVKTDFAAFRLKRGASGRSASIRIFSKRSAVCPVSTGTGLGLYIIQKIIFEVKIVQASAMKACLQIAECRLSSAKLVKIFCKSSRMIEIIFEKDIL